MRRVTYHGWVSLIGQKIGPYEVLEEIGAGGMARVYKAQQHSLDRMVAIKELRTEVATDKSVALRFEREARCVAALAHQNIVHVYDFITRGTSMFIVMEFVDGIDLYTLASRTRRLPPNIAAIIALQAARALEYAHFRGVVHRDFKPSNLMVTKQGDVKLMDFGIARDDSFHALTRPGVAIGTPAYMSPEQILGQKVDFRSDIFSFGIVLYQMLTGRKPFAEDDTRQVMQQIVTQPYEKPRNIYPDIPFALQRITHRCMEKRARHRYASTELLRRDLELFVAKRVPLHYSGRLVVYLRHRNLISDVEAKTYVGEADLQAPDSRVSDSGRVNPHTVLLRPLLKTHLVFALLLALWTGVVKSAELGRHVGYLRVNAAPWATVVIDGKEVAKTPLPQPIALDPGRYEVQFRNPFFSPVTKHIDITVDNITRVDVKMPP